MLSLVSKKSQIKHESQSTIEAALGLLRSLKPKLDDAMLPDSKVEVPLLAMDIMRSGRGKPTPHVLHIGPNASEVPGTALQRVTGAFLSQRSARVDVLTQTS